MISFQKIVDFFVKLFCGASEIVVFSAERELAVVPENVPKVVA
jgi:hypothetical protein